MAQARPLRSVGSRCSFFAASQPLAVAQTSYRLNQERESSSCRLGSGRANPPPAAMISRVLAPICKRRYHRTTRGNLDDHVILLSVHPLEYIQQTLQGERRQISYLFPIFLTGASLLALSSGLLFMISLA